MVLLLFGSILAKARRTIKKKAAGQMAAAFN
jgi:hypothetical protein